MTPLISLIAAPDVLVAELVCLALNKKYEHLQCLVRRSLCTYFGY
jgi:hypothetical protein